MLATHIDSFKILEFFPYPSFVQFEISSYDVFYEKRGDRQIMKLFESVLKRAKEITGKYLIDNKIAFKIFHIPTETTLYIGYKDGKYTLGLDVWSEVPSKKRVIEELESYLRPISSMTPEEKQELQEIMCPDIEIRENFIDISSVKRLSYLEMLAMFKWLDKHQFDYKK